MWFDGTSLIFTCFGEDNIYIDMVPVYLGIIAGLLAHWWTCMRKK